MISIKTAIILPFVVMMCVIVITFITLWKLDFDWISKEQSSKILKLANENISHIFDPFFTTNRNKGGSGLGLNIVYNLVTGQLNGKIKVLSEVNKGTTFNIILDLSTEGDI